MASSGSDPRLGESAAPGSPSAAAGPAAWARSGETPVAIAIVAIVAGVFVWWAWKQGAYFGSVFLPGAIILNGLLILLLLSSPFHGRLRGAALVALASLLGLAVLTLLAITWTSSNEAAVQDFERAMLYAAVFALGLLSCNLAGRALHLPLASVAATGVVVGIVTTITLAGGTDVASFFHDDATLRFPIGYRNAEAAFFLICLWPLMALAAGGGLPWQLRALMIGAATMVLELVVLAESRGSLPAAAVGLTVLLVTSQHRLRVAVYLCLAGLPVLAALPALLDVFQHGGAGPGLVPLMRDAAEAIALTSLGSIVAAAVVLGGVESRLNLGRKRVQLISRVTAVVAVVAVVAGGTVFMAERGGPLEFVDQRVHEFRYAGNPNLQPVGTRFGVNVGSNRRDFWRVALDEGSDHPILGDGPGAFATTYLQDRESTESPQDPHSVEMLMWSELGIVGLALFVTFLVGSAIAALRSRRLGPSAVVLGAGSLAASANWLVHASYDWFWHYPALTAPVMFLLGAAAAPSLFERGVGLSKRVRYGAAAAFAVALLIAVPLFLSQRYANHAYDEYPGDPDAALSNLDRAADLDPYDPQPLLSKGVIESRLGRQQEAVGAFREAIDRAPDGYAAHFFLARALADTDRAAARAEATEALALNPLDLRTRALVRRLERQRGP